MLFAFMCVQAFCQNLSGKRLTAAKCADAYVIYNVSDNGGVVVKINDDDAAVIAYTDKGDLNLAMKSTVFRAFVESLNENKAKCAKAAVANGNANVRHRIVSLKGNSPSFKPSVAPLLTDKWHQYYEPYNLLAPVVDSVHCVSGCVASAMAQVMHYWRYPEHGYGSHTYVDSLGCGQELTCDFSSHYYDWDNMLDSYENVRYSDTQAYAVAQLMLDCGISVNMKYGKDASGATSIRQPMALTKHFGYDLGAQSHFRDFYSLAEWTDMLKRELSEGRPVLMSGYCMTLAHAFVCDGYDENDFFHFSFGNPEGAGDGFFYLPYLTPDFPPEQVTSDPENGFNLLQTIVTGVMPASHPQASGTEEHVYAFSNIQLCVTDSVTQSKSVIVNRLGNIGWNLHEDSVGVAILLNDKPVGVPYVYPHDFLLEELDDTVYTDTIPVTLFESALARLSEDGTYKLVPMFKDNGTWKQALTAVGTPNYLLANKNGTQVTLSEPVDAHFSIALADITFPDWLTPVCKPDYTLAIQNGDTEFCGRIYILLENVIDTLPSVLLQEQGISLHPGELATRHFNTTTCRIPEGEYILRIYYESDLFSADVQLLDPQPSISVVVSKTRPTGIASTTSQTSSQTTYSLSGIPLSPTSLATPRIVISDGKKRLVKSSTLFCL